MESDSSRHSENVRNSDVDDWTTSIDFLTIQENICFQTNQENICLQTNLLAASLVK